MQNIISIENNSVKNNKTIEKNSELNEKSMENNEQNKEINPENHEFAKSEINPEETFHLKLNYSFQGRSEDSYSLS